MSHLDSSTLATYNSLVDPHLQCYFSNERIRSHLRHAGLISRRGEIVSDSEYRLKLARREHKKHVRQMLAENIVHRAIDLERARQAELKRQFDMVAKAALVNSVKESRRHGKYQSINVSNDMGLLSMQSSWSQPRPKSASQQRENDEMDEEVDDQPRIPRVHSAHVTDELRTKYSSKSPTRRRRPLNRAKSSSMQRPRSPTRPLDSTLSNPPCEIKMIYYGPHTKIDYDHTLFEPTDEIIVMQQHCGGENLVVHKENLKAGDEFTFKSRRHADYPLGLSLYINGLIDSRISTCCEYKHRHGVRLGGERGHFAIVSVQGSKPCLKCRFEKQARLKQYADSPKDRNETDDENKKAITISVPVSDQPKSKQTPVKIPVRRTPELNDNYSEDFDGSDGGKKRQSGYSSDSTEDKNPSRQSAPKVLSKAVRAKSSSDTSSTATERSDKKSSTKTWQIIFHTSNIPTGSFQLPKNRSATALLKFSFLSADGKDETESYEIDMNDTPQGFQSGRQHSFPAKLKNIGQPKQIRLSMHIDGDDDDHEDIKWHLDHIELIDPETQSHYQFPCQKWIYPSEEKILYLSDSPQTKFRRKTSNETSSSKSSSASSIRHKPSQPLPSNGHKPKTSSRSSISSSTSSNPTQRYEIVPKATRRISTDVESNIALDKIPYRVIIYSDKDDDGELNSANDSRIFIRLNNQTKDTFIYEKDTKRCPSFQPGESQKFEVTFRLNPNERPPKLTIGYYNSDITAGKWKLNKVILVNKETDEQTVFFCNESLIRNDYNLRAEQTFYAQTDDNDQKSTPRNVDVHRKSPLESENDDKEQTKPIINNTRKRSSIVQSPSPPTPPTKTMEKVTSPKSPSIHSRTSQNNHHNDEDDDEGDEDNEYNRMFKKKNDSVSRPKTRRGRPETPENDNEQENTTSKLQTNSDVWRPASRLDQQEPVDPLVGLDELQNQTSRSSDPKNTNSIPSSTTNQPDNTFKNWYPKTSDDDED